MKRPATGVPGQDDTRRAAPVLQHAEDHAGGEGEHAGGGGETRPAGRSDRSKPPPCCASSGTCPSNKPDNFSISTGEQMLRAVPQHHRDGGAGDGGAQLHRIAGGRHRRDEHHAGVGDRAHPRDRHSQGDRRAAQPTSCCSSSPKRWCSPASGGLIGMTLGWLISTSVRLIFPVLPTAVPLWAAALGVAVSVASGSCSSESGRPIKPRGWTRWRL